MKFIEFISVGRAIYLVVISIIGGLVIEIVRDSRPQHLTTGSDVMGWVDRQVPQHSSLWLNNNQNMALL